MSESLKSALDALYSERASLDGQITSLKERLALVDKGIAALAPLVPNAGLFDDDTEVPLWKHIQMALDALGHARPREIADYILSTGYVTTSKDFPNVVGTNLRAYPNRFGKRDDGNWANLPVAS